MRDVSAIGDALVSTVKGYVAPIAERLAFVERALKELPEPIPGQPGPMGPVGPAGADAEIDYSVVEGFVSKAVAAIHPPQGEPGPQGEIGPAGPPGESVDIAAVEILVQATVSKAVSEVKMPQGEPGPKGDPGPQGPPGQSVSISDIASLVQAEVAKAVAMIPVPRDGRDGLPGANGAPGRDGIDGQKGLDGRDGFSLEDLDISLGDDGRTVSIKFVRGELVREKSFKLATVLDRGVYRPENVYEKGDGCTWGGSYWIAQKDVASGKPGESDDWRLAVKKGRDGRDGERGKDYESTRSSK